MLILLSSRIAAGVHHRLTDNIDDAIEAKKLSVPQMPGGLMKLTQAHAEIGRAWRHGILITYCQRTMLIIGY
jgi:hypothetical protein